MKKKILFIKSSMGGGGAEKVLITTLKNFDYSRFEVHLCIISKYGVYLDEIPSEVHTFFLFEDVSSLYSKVAFNLYSKFRISILEKLRIRNVLDSHYDTIISFCEGRSLKFHGYVVDRATKNVSWVHIDLYANHHTVGDILSVKDEEMYYSKMDTIVFVSNDAKKAFHKLYQLQNKQVVIYNPIEREVIKQLSLLEDIAKEKFVIGAVGRLCPQKAFGRLIRVASRLKNDGYAFEVWIIGDGELRGMLLQEIQTLGLDGYVKLLGFKNPPYSYMSKFDIFISTSLAEGYPLVTAEVLCLGIPVVATKCTGPIEMLNNGKYGILTDHDDDSIYNGVKRLLDDKSLQVHYSNKSVEASMNFDVDAIMNEIYDEIN